MSDPIAVSLTPTVQAPVSLEVVEAPIQQIHVDLHQGTPGLSAYELAVSNGFAGTLAEWLTSLSILAGAVASVNGRSGVVVLTKVDVGLSRVSNTSDTEKLALLGSAIDTVVAEYSADPARVIQDTTHRFVSDAEKSTWNGKEDAGTAAAAVATHASAADPHGDRANAATLYQPLSAGKGLSTNDYTTAEKTKLAGIAAGATANSSDATLLARANHTGTQLAATISDFAVTARGEVTSGIADHAAAADPHGDRADAASKYQPLSAGKGLSTEDYTSSEKNKLAGIAAGATANTASTANPLQAGTAAPGTAAPYAREDHRHPVDTSREPAIASGTVSQFLAGTKTWRDLATDVRASVLTGYAIADSTIISATDTVIGALQKLDARIDEAAYQLQAGAAELAIPLSYTGTGAGVLTMRLFSDIAQTATIDGAGKFYTDAAGTLNEATSYAMAANAWTTFYIRVPSSTCTMRVPSGRSIRYFGNSSNSFLDESANGPKVNGLATTKIRQSVGSIYVYAAQNLCNVSGTTYPWLNATLVVFGGSLLTISGTTYPWLNATLVYFDGSLLTISGTTYPWLNATLVFFYGSLLTVSGTTYPWVNATSVFFSGDSLTVSGTTYTWLNAIQVYFSGTLLTVSGQTYPWLNAAYVVFNGNSLTTTANLSESVLYSGASSFELYISSTGMAVSYPTTRAWPRNISRVCIRPSTGSMVSADVDRILIDIASTASLAAVGLKAIYLGGNCGAHTSASDAAIATLTGLGFTVTVN